MSHRLRRSHHRVHRRFRHNPPVLSGARSSIGGVFKDSLLGAGGIVVNNLVSGQLGGLLGTTSIPGLGSPAGLVRIAVPVLAAVTIGKKKPAIRIAATVALSVALVDALKAMLPKGIPGLTGESSGLLMPAFSQPQTAPPFSMTGQDGSFALPQSIAE